MGLLSKLFRRGGSSASGGTGGNVPNTTNSSSNHRRPPHGPHDPADLKATHGGRASSSSSGGGGGGMVSRFRARRTNSGGPSSSSAPSTDRDSPTELMLHDPMQQPYPVGSNGAAAAALALAAANRRAGPDLSDGSQRVRSPRSDDTGSSGNGGGKPGSMTMPLASVGNNLNNSGVGGPSSNPSSSSPSKWRAHRPQRSPTTTSSSGPVDLDASDVESPSSRDEAGSGMSRSSGPGRQQQPRLSSQRLEEFEKMQQQQQSGSGGAGLSRVPMFTMEDSSHIRFSAGQLMQDTNSEDESSSFNLSTDAEDTDYENLKRRGVLPPMDTSTYSGQYNTDGETSTSVFPNLPTDDEGMSLATNDRDDRSMTRSSLGGMTNADVLSLSKASNDSSIDAMAWAKDNYKDTFKGPSVAAAAAPAGGSGFDSGYQASPAFNIASVASNGTTTVTRRNFTSPKKAAPPPPPAAQAAATTSASQFDDFANFADFSNVTFPTDPAWNSAPSVNQKPAPSGTTSVGAPVAVTSHVAQTRSMFEEKSSPRGGAAPAAMVSSAPAAAKKAPSAAVYTDTSLSELLAQAKSKSSRSRAARGASNSVNSAPALSSTYLRQHHGLKPLRGTDYPDPAAAAPPTSSSANRGGGIVGAGAGTGAANAGTSVSDIIHSLEVANVSRGGPTAVNTSHTSSGGRQRPPSRTAGDLDATSVHSRDNASVRSAKERLRRRREQRQNRPSDDSSDSDDNNGSESWLIDEVTGALGPRGIAPDLESLSGRSNRSRSSGGGRSHKSHRSHRSSGNRRSSSGASASRRQQKSSSGGDSVDSHGSRRSRGSRQSRSSRYSHRSTRSYLSQMSEQSRSVANDLLRLEMQLAMVGSGGGGGGGSVSATPDDAQPRSASGHSITSSSSRNHHHASSSRSSRPSSRHRAGSAAASAAARRTRMTIIAPPGRLGIILANRADSRGTVVSGVRTSSVMAEQISPGDRIVAIDGEDVSLMTVSEITTIMTRNQEFERTLTVLTTPRHTSLLSSAPLSGAAGGGPHGEPPLSPRVSSSSDYDYLHSR